VSDNPCVLVVADPPGVHELVQLLEEPLPEGAIDTVASSGGDDTVDLFEARKPHVVVITATLEVGDARSLIEALREMAPRATTGIILIGDDDGPIRTAIDAIDFAPDRFVGRPVAAKALRFAVGACLEAATVARMMPRTSTDQGTGVVPGEPRPPSNEPAIPPPRTPTWPGTTGTPRAPGTPSSPAITVPPQSPTSSDERPSGDRAAMRARWAALADAIGEQTVEDTPAPEEEAAPPLPPPIEIQPRQIADVELAWRPSADEPQAPVREPTLILSDNVIERPGPHEPPNNVMLTERSHNEVHDERWSEPVLVAELTERPEMADTDEREPLDGLDDFDDKLGAVASRASGPLIIRSGDLHLLDDLVDQVQPVGPSEVEPTDAPGRDFARQLRAKMSQMAQRLFQNDSEPPPVDLRPRHDHHTEIDLAALGEEPALRASVAEIRAEHTTSPGGWDTQVRERGLPDQGEVVRGVSDAALVLAKVFAATLTGRVGFRKGDVEKVVFFDQGRPVFASSNEPGDRMGELLVREGKITAAQYERCQTHVAQSGRRMGEILVDFGYLKRRELLPAVRRHVEDIVYSLFGWDSGHYHIMHDEVASTERIRLSRHAASLILEGIRRKHDRSTLERLVGLPSTVIEVPDRERLGGIVNTADLATEERAALAAFDGQADLAQVARTAGIDVADVLPLAWGLCVLGLATARRAEAEVEIEESTALVGETDLAIDRERVHARWQLVSDADYFALLGVRRDATAFEIRRAYQAARRDFAADCFPADLRRELARELDDIACVLDEAFRVLRDDRLRLTYLSNLIE
jgi:DNA-binding NarL/FixJ family response regulator